MKKRYLYILFVMVLLLCGCSAGKDDMKKLRDVEFTVMNPDEVPEELRTKMEEEKENGFMLTYADDGYLYIARGYGKQDTSGYSVEVAECYETEDIIYMKTNLLGPPKTEKILKKSTWPNVVIKTEYMDKNVVFE